MSQPAAKEMDSQVAASLKQTLSLLHRAFSEGVGLTQFPQTLEVVKQLQQAVEREESVEAQVNMGSRMAGQQVAAASGGGGKRVCCLVDGSSNSFDALRWALEHAVDPVDDIFLLTVTPHEIYASEAEKVLKDAYDVCHNAGVKAARLHPRSVAASCSSATRGVGEAVGHFVQGNGIELLVLGSRGLGSIKRSLMGTLGMGSLSDFCVQRVRCPVLVVKEQPDQQQLSAAQEQ
ncbi:hypothetical protein ABPG75_014014 [Micractinium tetrahymenae]